MGLYSYRLPSIHSAIDLDSLHNLSIRAGDRATRTTSSFPLGMFPPDAAAVWRKSAAPIRGELVCASKTGARRAGLERINKPHLSHILADSPFECGSACPERGTQLTAFLSNRKVS
jgi:hypothetical protein